MRDAVDAAAFQPSDHYCMANPKMVNPLSAREREVLAWLASGAKNDIIAFRMGVTIATVNFRMISIRRKLNAKTREQALAIAIPNGYIKP